MALSAEEAKSRLEALEDKEWRKAALKRSRKVRRRYRSIVELLTRPVPEYYSAASYQEWTKTIDPVGAVLDGLSPSDRREVFCALHPGLGPALAHWWVANQDQPYQRGWSRRAFRLTGQPQVTRSDRVREVASFLRYLGPYDADPLWLATWAAYFSSSFTGLNAVTAGGVLAAAIDLGGTEGEQTLQALMAVGNGDDPIGMMGRHVVIGLLRSADPRAWDYIVRMLLAAQRQEGLRQVILEAADEAHPQAFDLILTTVLDNKLLRFVAAVRSAGVWLGFAADVENLPKVDGRVRSLHTYRTDEAARTGALQSGYAWESYLALVALAMRDAVAATAEGAGLLRHPSVDVRAAAVRFLGAVGLSTSGQHLVEALTDEDLGVACLAASLLGRGTQPQGAFENLEHLLARLPEKPRKVENLGVESHPVPVSRAVVGSKLVYARGDRPITALLPWLPSMDSNARADVAANLAKERVVTPAVRAAMIQLMADRSSGVRGVVGNALKGIKLGEGEARELEALLTRSSSDLRRTILGLLHGQSKSAATASADRLDAGDKNQRLAAGELRVMLGDKAAAADVAAVADVRATIRAGEPRTAPTVPVPVKLSTCTQQDVTLLQELDALAVEHRNTEATVSNWQGSKDVLLGDLRWLPSPYGSRHVQAEEGDEDGSGLVLPEVFRPFFEARGTKPLDLLRAYALSLTATEREGPLRGEAWAGTANQAVTGAHRLRLEQRNVVVHVLSWLLAENADNAVVEECLRAYQTSLANVPSSVIDQKAKRVTSKWHPGGFYLQHNHWRHTFRYVNPWRGVLTGLLETRPQLFTPDQIGRWYRIERWYQQPRSWDDVQVMSRNLLIAAHQAGEATDADVVDSFLQPGNRLFTDLTRRWRATLVERHARLVALADEVRDVVVAAELTRGDLPTPTSPVAVSLGSVAGAELTMALLERLGKATLVRGYNRGSGDSREQAFSHLIRVSFPEEEDTAASLAAAAKAHKVTTARLVDLAVYAPQWASLVEGALGWEGLADGVLWLHAHTKDTHWSVDLQIRQSWAAMSAELTPLAAEDLENGAVDVDWFHRSWQTLGEQRWATLDKSAKLASSGAGHRRAQVFAEAMLGRTTEEALIERIRTKRNQDAVRALGLLPADDLEAIPRRYAVLREFERGSRQFGSQKQASEGTAVRVAIDNLARSAGFPDPLRFVWAMEAQEAGDLADGPVTVTVNDVSVTLFVTPDGMPEITVKRGDKTLQSLPVSLRKDEEIGELRARRTALKRQASRVRRSLESAMIAQDTFTASDLEGLRRHPLVHPMLEQLVWVDEAGKTLRRLDGVMADAYGKKVVAKGDLRIAHPVDLVADKSWVAWQEQLFDDARKQPFKQVFRELYVATTAERKGPVSNRYEGHQLQPRQALALLTSRGWLADRESGDASRVFHRHGVVARLEFLEGFLSPQEADLPTVGHVGFTRRSERLAQPIADVPDVVFSEAMRDLDLVVSVAHAGGVDPETTASTTEMRAALVRETARLLKLSNIEFVGDHLVIKGSLGEYSLHLGSAVVHRRPGGSVCIVPVGSQYRGRLFLPFADDDPKTAEVVAKAVLLAKDHEIKDPTILEQLRS